ncbi:MAG: hypothetical protein QF415_00785 [Candidatus Undinarchaeales archaeon]|jgi:hypothetical protein|nr:hypothetical protein [Candidatus Undinarchaeales archaeon]MDP7491831.1 hypothetical protein [Candidatus Undinarchaeales archaeon]
MGRTGLVLLAVLATTLLAATRPIPLAARATGGSLLEVRYGTPPM